MTEPGDRSAAQAEARAEARITAALSQLGAEHEPRPGWEARVLSAIVPEPRRRPWWAFAAPGLAVAVAAAVIVIFVVPPKPDGLALSVGRRDPHEHPPVKRGDPPEAHHLGETMRATVSGGGPHLALWVYRDERELVVACPRDPACQISSGALSVDFVLNTVGEYRIIALGSSAAPPEPTGTYDTDAAAAMRANVAWKDEKFHVQ